MGPAYKITSGSFTIRDGKGNEVLQGHVTSGSLRKTSFSCEVCLHHLDALIHSHRAPLVRLVRTQHATEVSCDNMVFGRIFDHSGRVVLERNGVATMALQSQRRTLLAAMMCAMNVHDGEDIIGSGGRDLGKLLTEPDDSVHLYMHGWTNDRKKELLVLG